MGDGGIGFCQGLVWMCSLVSCVNFRDPCLTEGQAWPSHVYKPKTLLVDSGAFSHVLSLEPHGTGWTWSRSWCRRGTRLTALVWRAGPGASPSCSACCPIPENFHLFQVSG